MTAQNFNSPLNRMVQTTITEFWNDSCSLEELSYAIENGAVGATCNPVIVGEVLKKELSIWKEPIDRLIAEMPSATEDEIAWRLIEEMSVKGAELLKPAFDRGNGKKGRLSIQTDPKFYRDAGRMVEQACNFHRLAPNMIVKIPVTKAGVEAIEEATYRGISINATVSFTVAQALAVAEAVERGLGRREKEGQDVSSMGPVCTIMVGRIDDWLKVVAGKEGIVTNPGYLDWAGVAIMKKAYRLYRERGYRLRLLAAAYRSHLHWSEFIGGEVVVSIPFQWQKLFNASDIEVVPRMDRPVDPEIIDELYRKLADFRRAYDEGGLSPDDFDHFGPTRRTLRGFIAGYQDFVGFIRDLILPNPDAKSLS